MLQYFFSTLWLIREANFFEKNERKIVKDVLLKMPNTKWATYIIGNQLPTYTGYDTCTFKLHFIFTVIYETTTLKIKLE